MKKNFIFTIAATAIFFIVGCEIGVNPLILDSSLSSKISINNPLATVLELPFPPITINTKSLQNVAGDDFKNANFYNMTLMVDNKTTPTNGKISAQLKVNDTLLVKMDSLSLSLFDRERSIFEKIPGFHIDTTGLKIVLRAVQYPPQNGIKLQMFVGPTNTPVDFDLWIKVYGQIQTNSK
jgi:hypothetical protein